MTKLKSNDELDLAKLRKKKKEEFVESAWGLISKCETLIERRLNRAIGSEDVIDELLDEILQLDHKELTEPQRKALYSRIAAIKIENVRNLRSFSERSTISKRSPTRKRPLSSITM